MKKNAAITTVTSILATFALVNNAFAEGASEEVEKQTSRQVARQITSAISKRIVTKETDNASSEEGGSFKPDSIWSAFSWSRITNDNAHKAALFSGDIFQTTTGVDKKFGDFYVGATFAYAGSLTSFDSNAVSGRSSASNISVVPYLGYVFNKNFFISAMSGYNYSDSSSDFGGRTTSHGNTSEIDLNGLHIIDNRWIMQAKVGGRYGYAASHTGQSAATAGISSANQALQNALQNPLVPESTKQQIRNSINSASASTSPDRTFSSWTFLVDAAVAYRFENGAKFTNGILYEYNIPTGHSPVDGSSYNGSSLMFYNAGFDYPVNKALTVGVSVSTDIIGPTIDLTTVGANMRLAL